MNQFDTRNRSAHDVVADIRKYGANKQNPCLVAVLGSHRVDASAVADAIVSGWDEIVGELGFDVVRVLTGCADAGAEKAARLAAKRITGELAVVFHRAELTYGRRAAEEIRDTLLAQEADALVIIGAGSKVCRHARDRFSSRGKRIIEVEVG